jgi:curved DNA-binding protein CbpA
MHHPDVDGVNPEDRDMHDAELLRIMEAFSVLRDPVRRAAYDRTAVRWRGQSAGATDIPVRKVVRNRAAPAGNTIRIMPVRWESGPWI